MYEEWVHTEGFERNEKPQYTGSHSSNRNTWPYRLKIPNVSDVIKRVDNENIEVIEVDYLGPTGTLFWNMDTENGGQMIPPYQLIDAKSIVAVSMVEVNRILGDMADVLTQAKMRSL